MSCHVKVIKIAVKLRSQTWRIGLIVQHDRFDFLRSSAQEDSSHQEWQEL
jgi:hypothetical protein